MQEIGIYFSVARPGGGKSVDNAKITRHLLLNEYPRVRKKYPKLKWRYILNNNDISEELHNKRPLDSFVWYKSAYDLKYCHRKNCWVKDTKDFGGHPIHDCDLFIDEIANILPAELWSDTPGWLRDIFSQHRKLGLRIFANSQDYRGVDVNFRRMVKHAYLIRIMFKSRDISASTPPVKWVHGIVMKHEIPPEILEEKGINNPEIQDYEIKWLGLPSSAYWMGNKLVNTFDSYYRVPRWRAQLMEEIVQECVLGDKCTKPRDHIRVIHRPV